jgi:hypothetical protein
MSKNRIEGLVLFLAKERCNAHKPVVGERQTEERIKNTLYAACK